MKFDEYDWFFIGFVLADATINRDHIYFQQKAGDVAHVLKFYHNRYGGTLKLNHIRNTSHQTRDDYGYTTYEVDTLYLHANEAKEIRSYILEHMRIPLSRTKVKYYPYVADIPKDKFPYFLLGIVLGNGNIHYSSIRITSHFKEHLAPILQYILKHYKVESKFFPHITSTDRRADLIVPKQYIIAMFNKGILWMFSHPKFMKLQDIIEDKLSKLIPNLDVYDVELLSNYKEKFKLKGCDMEVMIGIQAQIMLGSSFKMIENIIRLNYKKLGASKTTISSAIKRARKYYNYLINLQKKRGEK